jgi:hypothetical protein
MIRFHDLRHTFGFSRQHVVRLINAGKIKARKLPSSSYWQSRWARCLTSSSAANTHENNQTRSHASLTS